MQALRLAHEIQMVEGLFFMMQPLKLNVQEVENLVEGMEHGSVVIIDTLNRALGGGDENDSSSMGLVIEAAALVQKLIKGLVILIHHTGKDEGRGLRGHSSLVAALDTSIVVKRDTEGFGEWQVAKSKDGQGGKAYRFALKVQSLGCDEDGDEESSCSIEPGVETPIVGLPKLPQGKVQEAVYEAIGKALRGSSVYCVDGLPSDKACIPYAVAFEAARQVMTCDEIRKSEITKRAILSMVKRGIFGLLDNWLWLV
jgi:hypothetical protein